MLSALRKVLISSVAFLLSCASTHAVFSADLALSPLELASPATLAGQSMTLIVSVANRSVDNLTGTVKFTVDDVQIGTDQPVSVRGGGSPDEVFVAWVAVGGRHTLRAELLPYARVGDDPSNNIVTREITIDVDTDGDGAGDSVDTDDDNDGWSDAEEVRHGTDSLRADTDGDRVSDARDVFPLDPREQADTDRDGTGDHADLDIDGDTVSNDEEAKRGTDPQRTDTDGDDAPAAAGRTDAQKRAGSGLGDGSCDDAIDDLPTDPIECRDADGDGVGDVTDVFPHDPHEQRDTDRDGMGDVADADADGDGYCDDRGLTRGCQLNADSTPDAFPRDVTAWHDVDADGVADQRDPDSDNDTYCDEAPARDGCLLNADGSADVFSRDATEWSDADRDGLGDNADPHDANQGPLASIAGGDRMATVRRAVVFDAHGSTDVDGHIASMTWDFGDGTAAVEGVSATHTYDRLGIYTVRLMVTDDVGEGRVASAQITIENPPYLEWLLGGIFLTWLTSFAYVVYLTARERMSDKNRHR